MLIVNIELEGTCKEALMTYFKVLSKHFPGYSELICLFVVI
jgi:hypothetical protein